MQQERFRFFRLRLFRIRLGCDGKLSCANQGLFDGFLAIVIAVADVQLARILEQDGLGPILRRGTISYIFGFLRGFARSRLFVFALLFNRG